MLFRFGLGFVWILGFGGGGDSGGFGFFVYLFGGIGFFCCLICVSQHVIRMVV